jgi:hypothetical protein
VSGAAWGIALLARPVIEAPKALLTRNKTSKILKNDMIFFMDVTSFFLKSRRAQSVKEF